MLTLTNPDKKSLLYLVVVILAFFLAIFLIWHFSQKPLPEIKEEKLQKPLEKTREEIINDLTVPKEKQGKTEPVSQETLQKLTAPSKRKTTQSLSEEEIIKNLTAPKKQ